MVIPKKEMKKENKNKTTIYVTRMAKESWFYYKIMVNTKQTLFYHLSKKKETLFYQKKRKKNFKQMKFVGGITYFCDTADSLVDLDL